MKVKLVLLVLMCLFSGVICAQNGEQRGQRQQLSVEERAKAQTDRLKKELDLTAAQYDSVQAINLKYAKKAEELFKNNQNDRAKNRETLQKNQEAQRKELKAVLTESQYKKYEEQAKARRERMGNRGQRQGQNQGQRPQRSQRPQRNN
jgi:hypothetical protein